MRKMHILGLSLFAMCAFSALAAASAFAEETQWLLDAAVMAAPAAVETIGELVLTELKGPLGVHAAVLCSTILDGTVGAKAADEVTKLLTLEKLEVSTPLDDTTPLECSNFENCTGNAGVSLVWPLNLPWTSTLLLSGTTIIDDFAKKPGFEIDCTNSLIGLVEDSCEAEEALPLTATLTSNATAGDVEGTIKFEGALCSFSDEKSGDIETDGGTVQLMVEPGHVLAISGV